MLYQPLESLTYTTWAMEGATAGAKRCFEVLDGEDDVRDSPNAVSISSAKGAITFKSVNFGYAGDRHVLRDIDLRDRSESDRRPGRRHRRGQKHVDEFGAAILRSFYGFRHAG